jgi:ABC-type glycerol-3-phosphate transport system substrate-binding protein
MKRWLLAVGVALGLGALAQTGKLEIFSWWAGDEGPALEALILQAKVPRGGGHQRHRDRRGGG